ncbi:MAG TPA: TraR/DksA C4-type zinc finger protein [Gammaproteobacteria bacterium]|nr:TraR/DksA C4-type zinc finger protein [Gammaproteobacteria bacterium]
MAEAADYGEMENALRQQRAELRGAIEQQLLESEEDQFRDIAHRVRDAGEASVYDLVKSLEFDSIERESRELESVEHALTKFDNGQYGRCENCGVHIERERLRAEPTALRCLACQEKHEIEFESRRRPSL